MKKSTSYTMRDVARLAGVSVTTVSSIVNGKEGVSPELTGRVQDAIATLDYHPNELARGLKVNRTFTIGIILPDVSNLFFNEILQGVETEARRNGYSVFLCNSNEDPPLERELLTTLIRRRVDGILLASIQPLLEENGLPGRRPPIVCFDRAPAGFAGGVVVVDNVLAAYQAARHLIDLGHQRIAIITGPATTLTGIGRFEGFQKALEEAHLPLHDEYIRPGGYSTQGGYDSALEMLQLPTPPTAILACNNRMTVGLLRALKTLGLACPRDVSVCGFDDFDWSELFSPRLTMIVQPTYEMGKRATEMLLKMIRDPGVNHEIAGGNRVVMKAELCVRDSTAPPKRLHRRSGHTNPAIAKTTERREKEVTVGNDGS
jgi:LacI family transcriptional regulator